jgi:alkanesulfonate monooxygenase SsuD/methylene tetrahydromethanopterin reductase-like flavin-dependent oxidoreductase (luciferase family)
VTEGADKLVEAVRGIDAAICATGFRRLFDPFCYLGGLSAKCKLIELGVSVILLNFLSVSVSVFSFATTSDS